ncbi:hypothetical protein TNCT_137291 [Trichonephila clavata]|uniref:Uncharacterized protein n=1 Tax=Trichonephila clavata TaxID=2740835 RepID=A0A8X6FJL4_TRICU|nr:hypothetical protein TNCT_137291 [Trichonephila clavata]
MNNADFQSHESEVVKNFEKPFLNDNAFIDSVVNNAAFKCIPTEYSGSLMSTTHSNSFTNVTEMESFIDSNDPDDFSMYFLKSYRDMDSISSNLTSLSDSEGDVQYAEGSSVPTKRIVFQKVKKFLGRLMKATQSRSCC